jgi:hypothetical protein
MTQNDIRVPAQAGGAHGGPGNRIPVYQIDEVRSYMFEGIEIKEILHVDRLGDKYIAMAIERLAALTGNVKMWVWIGGEETLVLKLTEHWRIKIVRDGAVIVKVTNYVLIADEAFVLLEMDKHGYYVPVAKGREITWDGTEEYFTPHDLRRLVKDVARRILHQPFSWL